MTVTTTSGGCDVLICPTVRYPEAALAQATTPPYLWVGDHHLLDRAQVAELVAHLQQWLATGSLALPEDAEV
jgi:hypothetical protein